MRFRPRRHRADSWYTHFDATRAHEYGEGLRQEDGRSRYYRQIREIRDALGLSHEEARQRWGEYYAPGGVPIKPVARRVKRKIELAVRASTSDKRTCPFCRDAIYHPDEGGPDYVCGSCQAHYHLDCFEEELQGKCATLGCSARRVAARIRTRGHRQPTTATPVTRARPNQATVEEIDPERYRTEQIAREIQERAERLDAEEATEIARRREDAAQGPQEAAREPFWETIFEAIYSRFEDSEFLRSCRRDGPTLLGVMVLMLFVLAACWAIAVAVTS